MNAYVQGVISLLFATLSLTTFADFDPLECPPSEKFLDSVWDACFGTLVYADGEVYTGWWKAGHRDGRGKFYFGEKSKWAGQVYEGEWKNDKFEGDGVLTFPNGDEYRGSFSDGEMHGLGTWSFLDGSSRTGYSQKGKYVPHICTDMGLTRGSHAFEQCVLILVHSVLDE